ncbi:MAG TPA: endonuclease domain-containing protein [Candidatus Binatia bacterium]|nr:endonuclease domain-containing protein [Candidatus Binatia bacterium]
MRLRADRHIRDRERLREDPERYGRRLLSQRDWYLRRTFGIGHDQWEALNDAQDGRCAICGQPCQSGKRLAVDHDHATGSIRGLLCLKCNTFLGWYEAHSDRIHAYLPASSTHARARAIEMLPPLTLLRAPEVAAMTGLGRTTIIERIKRGTFPKPQAIVDRARAWTAKTISDWMKTHHRPLANAA